MSDHSQRASQSNGAEKILVWQTPTIHEDLIDAATMHIFSAGIDNYEGDNPVNYGS